MPPARPGVDQDRAPRRRPARLRAFALLLAFASPAGGTLAQELEPVVGADGEIHLLTGRPGHVHRGFTFGVELGVGDATAFGAGKSYSLSSLAGGASGPKLSLLVHAGAVVARDFRLGLVMGFTGASGDSPMGTSSATTARFDAVLARSPRGDGLYLRGAAGLAVLEVSSDTSTVTGRDDSATGLDLAVGAGWMAAPWREAHPGWTGHLMAGIDLGWQHYGGSGLFGGQVKSALHWSLRVGFYTW